MEADWGPEGPQRGYRSTCGCVHFYPSHCWRTCCKAEAGKWYDDRPQMEGECASMFLWERDFTPHERLSDADALAIWKDRAPA